MLIYRVYGLISFFFLGVAIAQLIGCIVRLYPALLPVFAILGVISFLFSQLLPKAKNFILIGLISLFAGGLMAWL